MSQNNNFLSTNEKSSLSFTNDVDENKLILTSENNQILSSNLLDELNNNNTDDWKSADDNSDIDVNEIQDDLITVNNEQNNNDGWANFNTFENNVNHNSEVNYSFHFLILRANQKF
ncbi:unnamed protein product [Rotaria sp. Silwood2]|nr:unnamed protein product [Rotaria sp. Silwood2]